MDQKSTKIDQKGDQNEPKVDQNEPKRLPIGRHFGSFWSTFDQFLESF